MIFEQRFVCHLLHERFEVETAAVDSRRVLPEPLLHQTLDRVRVRDQLVVLVAGHGVEPLTVDVSRFGRVAASQSTSSFSSFLSHWLETLELKTLNEKEETQKSTFFSFSATKQKKRTKK